MGIVYNTKNYISKAVTWSPVISRPRALKALTRQNKKFLKSQGLRVVPGGG